jgi:hydroxyethylthiazole kinase-like sugar kinase family protein
MNKKFVVVGILLVFVMSLMVGAVSAQSGDGRGQGQGQGQGRGGGRGGERGDGLRDIVQVVVDATGLDGADILQQLRDGAILADIITANGGDVNAVIAEALAVVTEKTNEAVANGNLTQERADEILANAETRITEAINNPMPNLGLGGEGQRGDGLRDIVQVVVDATGLDGADIAQQLRDGATLAEIITANGGDVNAVIAEALAVVTEKTNEAVANGDITQERADEILANVETRITEAINSENPIRDGIGGRVEDFRNARPNVDRVFRDALEETGLTREEIRTQLEGGATMRQLLTDAGLDVAALTAETLANAQTRLDEAVANNRITAEQAATRLSELEARINELLDKTFTPRTEL